MCACVRVGAWPCSTCTQSGGVGVHVLCASVFCVSCVCVRVGCVCVQVGMHRVGVLPRGYAASASADWDASQLGMELVTGEGGW